MKLLMRSSIPHYRYISFLVLTQLLRNAILLYLLPESKLNPHSSLFIDLQCISIEMAGQKPNISNKCFIYCPAEDKAVPIIF